MHKPQIARPSVDVQHVVNRSLILPKTGNQIVDAVARRVICPVHLNLGTGYSCDVTLVNWKYNRRYFSDFDDVILDAALRKKVGAYVSDKLVHR